ncbi:MAG: hypothetical protein AAFR46_02390 [Pseudomonadota bacterium]
MSHATSTLRFGDGISGHRPKHGPETQAGHGPDHSPDWTYHNDSDPGSALPPGFGAGLDRLVFEPLSPAKADTADSHDRYANLETAYLLDVWSPLDM